MTLKEKTLFIVILALAGFVLFLFSYELLPPSTIYSTYSISGEIKPAENTIGYMPHFISVHYSPKFLRRPCEGNFISNGRIEWSKDNKTGRYEVFLSVPSALKQVLITSNCETTDYKVVDLNEKFIEIDLQWTGSPINDDKMTTDIKTISRINIERFGRLYSDVGRITNESIREFIYEYIDEGYNSISNAENSENETIALLNAYYSEWFSWKSFYLYDLYELGVCTENIDSVLESHKNDKCYVPDYDSFQKYKSANGTYNSYKNQDRRRDYPYSIKDLDKMNGKINSMKSLRGIIYDKKTDCEEALNVINQTFSYQQPFCETRKLSINLAIILWFILFFYFGIAVEKIRVNRYGKK